MNLEYTGPYGDSLRRLRDEWRDVVKEIDRLQAALDSLAEGCACGDAAAHPQASCPCGPTRSLTETHVDCATLLRTLRCRIRQLADGTLPNAQLPEDVHHLPRLDQEQMRIDRIVRHAHALIGAFGRVETAAQEFSVGYEALNARRLKVLAVELKDAAHELDALLA